MGRKRETVITGGKTILALRRASSSKFAPKTLFPGYKRCDGTDVVRVNCAALPAPMGGAEPDWVQETGAHHRTSGL